MDPTNLSCNELEIIKQVITTDYEKSGLPGSTIYHGTSASEAKSVYKGPKNIGTGLSGSGLYVSLDRKIAEEFSHIKTQFSCDKAIVLEGALDPKKNSE